MKRFGKKTVNLHADACCADCFDSWHGHSMIQKKARAKVQAPACTPSSAWTPQGWGRLQISQLDDMPDEARHTSSHSVNSAKDLKSFKRVV